MPGQAAAGGCRVNTVQRASAHTPVDVAQELRTCVVLFSECQGEPSVACMPGQSAPGMVKRHTHTRVAPLPAWFDTCHTETILIKKRATREAARHTSGCHLIRMLSCASMAMSDLSVTKSVFHATMCYLTISSAHRGVTLSGSPSPAAVPDRGCHCSMRPSLRRWLKRFDH